MSDRSQTYHGGTWHHWAGAAVAIVTGAALEFFLRGKHHGAHEPLIPLVVFLAIKLGVRQPAAQITWVRLTIVELAMVPQLSGHFSGLGVGQGLGLIALAFLTTPRVPLSQERRFMLYATPLAALVLLRAIM